MDFRGMAERRNAALSYLKTRPGEHQDRRLDRRIDYLLACGRPLLPVVFATESIGADGGIRRGMIGRNKCGDRLCGSCAALASQAHGDELSAGVREGVDAGLTTYHVVLTIAKPLDVSSFTSDEGRERIGAFWRLLRATWGEFSRRERAKIWVSHFRATDWTASPGIHIGGKVIKAGLFPHFHLLVQTQAKLDPYHFAQAIHSAWVRSICSAVRKARNRDQLAYDWINLDGGFCEAPQLIGYEIRGGVHVRLIERTDAAEMRKAIEYAADELVASNIKTGKRKSAAANSLKSYSIGELLELRGTRLEGFARSAFRLYAQLTHGLPGHMYSRGKSQSLPQLRKGAYAVRQERSLQDPKTRLAGLELRERADANRLMELMTRYHGDVAKGLDEWQAGFYLPEAVPAFDEDLRSQEEKRSEFVAGLERIKEGYKAYLKRT